MSQSQQKPANDEVVGGNTSEPQTASKPVKSSVEYSIAQQREQQNQELLRSFEAYETHSFAREGEILPPPPKSLDLQDVIGAKPADGSVALRSSGPVIEIVEEVEEVEPEIPPEPGSSKLPELVGVNLLKLNGRADLIRVLTLTLPLSESGFPGHVYRPDVIDFQTFVAEETTDEERAEFLEVARLELDYSQGFPATEGGLPVWAKLPYESQEAYDVFTQYCALIGAREVHRLEGAVFEAKRLRYMGWYHENYWALRARCYDLMARIHAAKKREQRMLACDDSQYELVDGLLQRLSRMAEDVDFEKLSGEPEKYVTVLEKFIKLQRQILGLMSNNGSTSSASLGKEKVDSVEIALRRMSGIVEEGGKGLIESKADEGALEGKELAAHKSGEGFDIRSLLRSDEGLVTSAQELIIKMTRSTRELEETTTHD